jgi:hypothetical protein
MTGAKIEKPFQFVCCLKELFHSFKLKSPVRAINSVPPFHSGTGYVSMSPITDCTATGRLSLIAAYPLILYARGDHN